MGRRPSIPLEIRMKAFMIDPDDDELHEDTNETERFERYIKHSNDVALHIYNCIIIIDTHSHLPFPSTGHNRNKPMDEIHHT